MALHGEILEEIRAGRIPPRFKTRDLKTRPSHRPGHYWVGSCEFAENALNTIPRNHSVRPDGTDPGDYVRKGRAPAFIWLGNGTFELIGNRADSADSIESRDFQLEFAGEVSAKEDSSEIASSGTLCRDLEEVLLRQILAQERPDPAAIIVRYIAEKPFRRMYRGRPFEDVKQGWGLRLPAYFWPTPDRNWSITLAVIDELADRVQRAIAALDRDAADVGAARNLLAAFEDTCRWGGVKLPEANPNILAQEVVTVWRALKQDQVPSPTCRLNSAWTKLYALALPQWCVIYDSRVAAALTSILDPVMGQVSLWPSWRPYLHLGTIPGRGGSRPRSLNWRWPNGYGVWKSQVAANQLSRAILHDLNHRATGQIDCSKVGARSAWTLREVEAVLFMEGY